MRTEPALGDCRRSWYWRGTCSTRTRPDSRSPDVGAGSRAVGGVPDGRCTDRASHLAGKGRTVCCMDNRAEVREFLVTRRAKISPEQAGLPQVGSRQVPGLRRGEVASLAGVSIEYYSRLERGALAAITSGPAIVRNGRMDLLATNHLGRAMHSSLYDSAPPGQPNFARYTFLDDDAHGFYPDWDTAADIAV